jgi:PIN domain nuclease of toxin-antitoxin system
MREDPAEDGALLLDTHVLIWLMEGVRDRMSARTIKAVERAARRGQVYVSAMSVWEIAFLESRKRITLSTRIDRWIHDTLRTPGFHLLELQPDISIESASLPGTIHNDPVDKILIATARVTGATLGTADTAIIKYSQTGHLRTLNANP